MTSTRNGQGGCPEPTLEAGRVTEATHRRARDRVSRPTGYSEIALKIYSD